MPARWSRLWFGATAVCVVAGVLMSVVTAAQSLGGPLPQPPEWAAIVFAVFSVQSTLIVGATSLLLALRRAALGRLGHLPPHRPRGDRRHRCRLPRGPGPDLTLDDWPLAADQLLHTVVPIMAVVGWLAYGPRGLCSARIVRLSVLFPIAWVVFTFIRGAVIHWYPYPYPYPFIDVDRLGYTKTILNCVWIALLWLARAGGATLLDRWLTQRSGRLADAA